ncbi:ABC transporter substrate-binding protein [Paenibacillus camelliae]|uniref:ABC transporter substrate-binding protein n=1 Tax=Paenibacillus camelliae TaxID=512410 RepID=UPI0020415EE1|nr:ABC transporter substrate-binding protein [Paenibacillus camelliae]MCM3631797.1 ABC transporter substrate-binding protein [Paenibacillus camelliae]
MIRKYVVASITLLAILVAGCASQGNNHLQEGKTRPQPAELVLAIGGEPAEGFDPTTGWGRYGSPLFQSTLFKRDSQLNIIGDAAVSYTISDDGLSWQVELREDIEFSDETPLTAEDVVFTFETAQRNASVVDLTNVRSITALSTYQVQFELEKAQSSFIDLLTTIGIVPKHAYSDRYAQQPIGSGPYKLVQWEKGQQLIVEQNERYYGPQSSFKRLVFLFLDEDASLAAAKAGKVHIVAVPSTFSKQNINGMKLKAVQSVDNRGIMFPYQPEGNSTAEGYPIGNAVTSELAIRQAMNIAIDRELLVEGVLEGYGTPAYSVNDQLPWWNEASVVQDADPDAAMKLLADGGWYDSDGDGILEKNGVKAQFTLLYPAGDSIRQSLAIAVADMIKPIGISIQAEGKSWDEIGRLMYSQPVMLGWGSLDPLEMYHVYSSSYAGVGYFNPGYYSNDTVDQYMKAALEAVDMEQAHELWKKAQWDGTTGLSTKGDAPWAWLVNIDHLYYTYEQLDIGEQPIHPHGHGWPITSNIDQWKWVE